MVNLVQFHPKFLYNLPTAMLNLLQRLIYNIKFYGILNGAQYFWQYFFELMISPLYMAFMNDIPKPKNVTQRVIFLNTNIRRYMLIFIKMLLKKNHFEIHEVLLRNSGLGIHICLEKNSVWLPIMFNIN